MRRIKKKGEKEGKEKAGEMEKINDASLPTNNINSQLSQMSFLHEGYKNQSDGCIIRVITIHRKGF